MWEALTPNWNVVDHHHHGPRRTESEESCSQNTPASDYPGWNCRRLGHEYLNRSEGHYENPKENQQDDDLAAVPSICGATPLKG